MDTPKLSLEILSGPLDGLTITIETETEWSSTGDSPLSFPWDEQLGTPQARLLVGDSRWQLEPVPNQRSTRHNMERVEGRVSLAEGDLFKAANSWLLISQIE